MILRPLLPFFFRKRKEKKSERKFDPCRLVPQSGTPYSVLGRDGDGGSFKRAGVGPQKEPGRRALGLGGEPVGEATLFQWTRGKG